MYRRPTPLRQLDVYSVVYTVRSDVVPGMETTFGEAVEGRVAKITFEPDGVLVTVLWQARRYESAVQAVEDLQRHYGARLVRVALFDRKITPTIET